MAGMTNRGKYLLLEAYFRGTGAPTNLYAALCTSANAPSATTNTLSELTEVATGNGYTAGGIQLNPNATDFDVLTEDDTGNIGLIQIKDLVWTASGGPLPSDSVGSRYMVITTDEATVGNRQIIAYFDLISDRVVSDGQTLTIQNAEIDLTE